MYKSIRLKLFIAFLFSTLLIVAGMYLFMLRSLNQGFTEFIETRQRQRIEQVIDNLVDNYAESNSWKPLANNKRRWIRLLRPERPGSNHRPHPSRQWMNTTLQEPRNRWPPRQQPESKGNGTFQSLRLRVMLLDTDLSIVFGREEDLDKLTLYPIDYQQKTIGYLGLLPGKPTIQLDELRFMEHQSKAIIWVSLIMIVLSAGLALLLAYILGRPIKKITAATKELGMGHYNLRLAVESKDELGQLALDFNLMASALEQSEQSRQRWISDISHELRTPLAVLRGELEALQDGIRPMNRAAIDSLFSDVMRLNRLTEDLYQLTLSDQGALTYRKTELDVIALLQQCITGLKPEFDKKNISVQLLNKTGTGLLYADPDRLSQLFQNLLNNSAKYTDNNGFVHISVTQKSNKLVIDMADSAPGVPEQEQLKLFKRFYRLESSRNRKLGGAGLGLAICSNIVAAHAGIINAQPSALGGLNIHIEFPL